MNNKNQPKILNLQKELAFLYRVSQSIHSLEIAELLEEIVDIAGEVTNADSCLIYIFDERKKELILRASQNPHPDLLKKITLKLGEGITGWVAKEKKPLAISSGASKDTRFKFFRSLPEDMFEAFLSVPIIYKSRIEGVINVQHKRQHVHTQMEVNLLTAIGKLVGGVLENALLVEETLALREMLELRKTIEKAKGILMKKKGLTEEEAYKLLQKESMDTRMSLKEIADAIILSEKINLSS